MKKSFKAFIFVLLLILTLNISSVFAASNEVSYLNRYYDTTEKIVKEEIKTISEYNKITENTTKLTEGWYVVENEVIIYDRIEISGEVNIILLNNCDLIANYGISVNVGNTIRIYSQPEETGHASIKTNNENAALGSDDSVIGGNIYIYSGNYDFSAYYDAAAIGGGYQSYCNYIEINGGIFNFNCSEVAIGVGTNAPAASAIININGGSFNIKGSIGLGVSKATLKCIFNGGSFDIVSNSIPCIGSDTRTTSLAEFIFNNGYFNLKTSGRMCCIGSGEYNSNQHITINGGYIKAQSEMYAAIGIESKSSIVINGGFVDAYSRDSAGIGVFSSEYYSNFRQSKIEINGGTVISNSAAGAGIIAYINNNGSAFYSTGGNVISSVSSGCVNPTSNESLYNNSIRLSSNYNEKKITEIGFNSETPYDYSINDAIVYNNSVNLLLPAGITIDYIKVDNEKIDVNCTTEEKEQTFYLECAHTHDIYCEVCNEYFGPAAELITNENYDELNIASKYVGYYLLDSAEDLLWFSKYVNSNTLISEGVYSSSSNAVLAADIDLSAYNQYLGIGTTESKYSGNFDGQNHKITLNMSFKDDNAGLFRIVKDATINNLFLDGEITTKAYNIGSLVGTSEGEVTISQVISSATINTPLDNSYNEHQTVNAGGLIGYAKSKITITNCAYIGTINQYSTRYVGQLCGRSDTDILITASYTTTCLVDSNNFIVGKSSGNTSYIDNYSVYENNNYGFMATVIENSAVKTGKLAYLLSQSEYNIAWGQNLLTDDYPVFDKDIVYKNQICANTFDYSNTYKLDNNECTQSNGVCIYCHDGYLNKEPVKVSEENYAALGLTSEYIGYYAVNSAEELLWISYYVNNISNIVNVVLINDIDLSNYNWIPMGYTSGSNETNSFYGIFDGNYHEIQNMNIYSLSNNLAFFGSVYSSTIKNVGFVNSTLNSCYEFTASTIAVVSRNSTFENCYVYNTESDNSKYCKYAIFNVGIDTNYIKNSVTDLEYLASSFNRQLSYSSVDYNASELTSGIITYYLNNSSCEGVYKQTLDGSYPSFKGLRIYPLYNKCSNVINAFSNTENSILEHTFIDGICTAVEGETHYQTPNIVDGYYQISNYNDLLWYKYAIENLDSSINAKLTNDIDLAGKTWQPINQTNNPYIIKDVIKTHKGIFDGGNHKISNIYMEADSDNKTWGLFGASSGTICNLIIENITFKEKKSLNSIIGSITGILENGKISNCIVNGIKIYNLSGYTGGLSGVTLYSTINDCLIANLIIYQLKMLVQ